MYTANTLYGGAVLHNDVLFFFTLQMIRNQRGLKVIYRNLIEKKDLAVDIITKVVCSKLSFNNMRWWIHQPVSFIGFMAVQPRSHWIWKIDQRQHAFIADMKVQGATLWLVLMRSSGKYVMADYVNRGGTFNLKKSVFREGLFMVIA
jgi:hypothetical protein